MSLVNTIIKQYLLQRYERIAYATSQPHVVQRQTLMDLLHLAKNTEWGRKYRFEKIRSEEDYKNAFPVQNYDTLKPYFQRTFNGEQNVIWPTHIHCFSKSSGTTEDRSKFIPVSRQSLRNCHYRAGRDILTLHVKNNPDSLMFEGKTLILTGSVTPNPNNPKAYSGDISGILVKEMDFWIHHFRTPSKKVALIADWEEKIEKIIRTVRNQNVTAISGVPSWMLVVVNRLLEETGKTDLREIWPGLEVFIHGAVNFAPYIDPFRQKIPHTDMRYQETYNASEGFFGIQDTNTSGDMLLMTDYGIYFEFIPMDELGSANPRTLTLREVEPDTNYAIVISTNSGLWRYMIGDTIKFTSTRPYRLIVSGRTKHFINAFGEELVVENAEQALAHACRETGATIQDYTVAPVYISDSGAGSHEWLIEFEQAPASLDAFTNMLDDKLKMLNSDYDAKRKGSLTLRKPIIRALPSGTFFRWMKKKGKLGAQVKVPRLYNDRKYVDEIIRDAGIDLI